ncbi:MAG: flavodoxin family protein [Actinobacteria bacterium]|nr:flavodoxin family protein [Actinomycetota bacterium]
MKSEKSYKVVAVYGSPRRGGNTDELLNKFLTGLENCVSFNSGTGLRLDIEKIFISDLKISSCRECRHCSIDGDCAVNDDMQQIYPKLMECNLAAIASPIFFTTVSGHLKAFIDRFQRFWVLKYELSKKVITVGNRKGILFSCAGSEPEDIFDCTKKAMRALFDVLYIKYFADFCYNNIDLKGDILKNQDILDFVYEFGKKGEFVSKGEQ